MFSALIASALLLGAAPKVVAPEWNAVNMKKELATFYADQLADGLRKQGLEVVTAQDIATLLGMERQRALVGCSDEANSCMAELANALGCDATLVVNLVRFEDGGFRGLAKLISSKTGATLSSAQLDSRSERKLLDSLEEAAQVLATPFSGKAAPVKAEPTASGDATRFWWLPGALGVAAGAAGAGMLVAAQGEHDAIPNKDTFQEAQVAAETGKALQTGGWVAVGVGAGLVVTGAVMLLWPKSEVVPTAVVTPNGASVGVGGHF